MGSCSRAQKLIEISESPQGGGGNRSLSSADDTERELACRTINAYLRPCTQFRRPSLTTSSRRLFRSLGGVSKSPEENVCNRTRKWREQRNKSASEQYGCGVRSMRCSCDAIKNETFSRPWLFALKINSTIREYLISFHLIHSLN